MLLVSRSLEEALACDLQLGATGTWASCSHLPELGFSEVEEITSSSYQVYVVWAEQAAAVF